jgi:glycosyltransferase involved in cell wall biosynthesis
MKILLAAGIYPPDVGGPATYTRLLASYLVSQGHQVVVICYSDTEGTSSSDGIIVHRVSRHAAKIVTFFRYVRVLWRESDSSAILYAQGPIAGGLQSFLVHWFKRLSYSVKITGDYAWEQATHRFHNTDSIDVFQKRDNQVLQIKILRFLQRLVVRNARTVIVPSEYLKTIVEGWIDTCDTVKVVRNAVQIMHHDHYERAAFRTALGFTSFTVLSGGRLVPWKGLQTLIRAFASIVSTHTDVRLVIVGDGPLRSHLAVLIDELHLADVITLAGTQSRDMMVKYYTAADMFILNSSYEGLSHMLLEAQSHGVPCAASNVGGNPECITHMDTGQLFTFDDQDSICASIEYVITHQIEARDYALRAQDRLRSWTFDMMLQATERILGSDSVHDHGSH